METYEQIKADRDFYKGLYQDTKLGIRSILARHYRRQWELAWLNLGNAADSYARFCVLVPKLRPMTAFAMMWWNLGRVLDNKEYRL